MCKHFSSFQRLQPGPSKARHNSHVASLLSLKGSGLASKGPGWRAAGKSRPVPAQMPRRTAEIASDSGNIHFIMYQIKDMKPFLKGKEGNKKPHSLSHTAFYPSNLPPTPIQLPSLALFFFHPKQKLSLQLSQFLFFQWRLLKSPIWSKDQNHSVHVAHLVPQGTAYMENSWGSGDPHFQLRCSLSSWSHPPVLFSDALLQNWGTMALWPMHKPWHGGGTMELAPSCLQALSVLFLFLHEATIKDLCPCALPSVWDFWKSAALLIYTSVQ